MIIGNAKDLIDRESQLQTCTGSLLLVRAVEQTVSQLAMQHSIGLCPIPFPFDIYPGIPFFFQ